MTAEEFFESQAFFNKWLKELTETEREHIINMLEEFSTLKEKENERFKIS